MHHIDHKWTDEEEQKLKELQSSGSSITLADTQLGRIKKERQSEFEADLRGYSKEEYNKFIKRVRPEDRVSL